jgi:hypothetical protein
MPRLLAGTRFVCGSTNRPNTREIFANIVHNGEKCRDEKQRQKSRHDKSPMTAMAIGDLNSPPAAERPSAWRHAAIIATVVMMIGRERF